MPQAVLTYHSLDHSGSVISIKPETFREQIRWLLESGIAVVPVPALGTESVGRRERCDCAYV